MDKSYPTLIADIALASLGLFLLKRLVAPSRTLPAPLPPGPKARPLIGNLLDLPQKGEQEWVHWGKFKEQYGALAYLSVFGQELVVINDVEVALDLFEKHSAKYSDRPVLVFGGELCGWDNALSSQMYSDRFRAYRKNIHALLGSKAAVARFHRHIETEAQRFLLRTLEDPQGLAQHIRKEAGAIILKIAYGYTVEPHTPDPLVDLADEALAQFSAAAQPGMWIVDLLPFLKHVPEWMPGAGFKRTAARWKSTVNELADKPLAFVRQQMTTGTAAPSYTTALLEKDGLSAEEEFVIKWSAASLYSGGADTTVSSLKCFFLALTLFPSIQTKAREELDRVLGAGPARLPTFEDRANLPYVDAVVKEVLRWHPVAPMGLPHVAAQDDVYRGTYIPKGAILMPNIWNFLHDPKTYKDPHSFNPDRFMGPNPEPDPHEISFGFGRRICPGRELADASLFVTIATALCALDVSAPAPAPKQQQQQKQEPRFQPGIISHPEPFRCEVRARNARAEGLVRAVLDERPFEVGDGEALAGIKWE